MNHTTRSVSILVLSLAAQLAYAHDPKEHAKEAAAAKAGPDCAAMKDMDQSKMDPNDPVTKAMMAKCGVATVHDEKGSAHANKPAHEGTQHEPHEGH